jgi:hypothetical protein
MNKQMPFIKLQSLLVYSNLFHIGIDRTIMLVEDLHKTVDNFVFDVQHQADKPVVEVQTLTQLRQQRISRSYQFVREINRRLGLAVAECIGTLQHRDNIKMLTKIQ